MTQHNPVYNVIYMDASRLARNFNSASDIILSCRDGLAIGRPRLGHSLPARSTASGVFIHFIEEEVVIDCMGNIPQQMERLRSRYS
jgi:hypothetical protein